MGQCKCYEIRLDLNSTNSSHWYEYGVCLGTKEQDRCTCGGDESKCNFYPEKRKAAEKPMNTAEMWLEAQEDGEVYVTTDGDTSYSEANGFIMENLHVSNVQTLSDWMSKMWKKQERRKMTKAEAEKEFGIRIVD